MKKYDANTLRGLMIQSKKINLHQLSAYAYTPPYHFEKKYLCKLVNSNLEIHRHKVFKNSKRNGERPNDKLKMILES